MRKGEGMPQQEEVNACSLPNPPSHSFCNPVALLKIDLASAGSAALPQSSTASGIAGKAGQLVGAASER